MTTHEHAHTNPAAAFPRDHKHCMDRTGINYVPCTSLTHCPSICDCPVDACTAVEHCPACGYDLGTHHPTCGMSETERLAYLTFDARVTLAWLMTRSDQSFWTQVSEARELATQLAYDRKHPENRWNRTELDGCQLTNHLAAIYLAAEQHTAAALAMENYVSHPIPNNDTMIPALAKREAELHYAFKDLLMELAHEVGVHPADVLEAIEDYHDEENAK